MRDVVLITGAAGFIGHHLVDHCLARTSYNVAALDRFDAYAATRQFDPLVAVLAHDLQNPLIHAGMLAEMAPRIRYVINLAADSHVDRSIADPLSFVRNNVVSAANMLDYTRLHLPGVKFLQMSTDEVFGPAALGREFFECDRFMAGNPYAASKCGAEALMPAWANTYGMEIVVVRATNIYGTAQHQEKFIPLACERLLRGEKLQIHSRDGVPSSRMYLHVSDLCRALHVILEHGDTIQQGTSCGFYNVAGAREYSNVEVAKVLARQLRVPLDYELVEDPPNRPRPDMRYAVSWDRLRSLGWEPRISLEAGLRSVCEAAKVAA